MIIVSHKNIFDGVLLSEFKDNFKDNLKTCENTHIVVANQAKICALSSNNNIIK